jgi:histidinol phosphatase-like enzyme
MLIQKYILSKHLLLNPLAAIKHRFLTSVGVKSNLYFLDLDGTLWPDRGPGALLRPFDIYPYWRHFFNQRDPYKTTVLLTNQAYFARKVEVSVWECLFFYAKAIFLMYKTGATLMYVCNHHPNAENRFLRKECQYRKPYPSMVIDSLRLLNHESRSTYLVGDRISDILAANLGGIETPILVYNDEMFTQNISRQYALIDHAFFEIVKFSEIDERLNRSKNEI